MCLCHCVFRDDDVATSGFYCVFVLDVLQLLFSFLAFIRSVTATSFLFFFSIDAATCDFYRRSLRVNGPPLGVNGASMGRKWASMGPQRVDNGRIPRPTGH